MKAAVFKAPGAPLVIEDVPDPTPGPNDMILKVRASGICGTDLHWSECRDHSVGWRVLAPDMPGRGGSGWLADKTAYGNQLYRQVCATLIAMSRRRAPLISSPVLWTISVSETSRWPASNAIDERRHWCTAQCSLSTGTSSAPGVERSGCTTGPAAIRLFISGGRGFSSPRPRSWR